MRVRMPYYTLSFGSIGSCNLVPNKDPRAASGNLSASYKEDSATRKRAIETPDRVYKSSQVARERSSQLKSSALY